VQALTAWDRRVFAEVNHGLKNPVLDVVMPRISDLGLGHIQVLFILFCAIFAGWRNGELRLRTLLPDMGRSIARRSWWVVPMLIAFVLSGIGATAFKRNVDRDRPAWFYYQEHLAGRSLDVHVETVGRRPLRVHGFLSGHTSTSVALAMAATLLFWRRRRAALIIGTGWALSALISISRIYIADHWPLDVACGAILGVLSGIVAVWGYRKWTRTRRNRAAKDATEESSSAADNSPSAEVPAS
jgi:membrane-associated phospholipid phosphatase